MAPGATESPAAPRPRPAAAPAPSLVQRLGYGLAGLFRPRLGVVPLGQLGLAGGSASTQAAVRALATGIPMQDAMLCRVLGRYKMLVDPADRGFAPHLLLDGFWEWWTTGFLARHLRPGDQVVEAGACYGYFSLPMAELIGPQGRLTVFEPNPAAATLLERNLELNGLSGRVRLMRAAVVGADSSLSAPLLVPAHAPMAARLGGLELAGVDGPGADQRVARVPCRPLDTLADEAVDWVKLDLPGSAATAWNGMQRLLERRPHLRVLLAFDPARTPSPAAFIDEVARRFPLRLLEHDGSLRRVDTAAVVAGGVRLLYLAPES